MIRNTYPNANLIFMHEHATMITIPLEPSEPPPSYQSNSETFTLNRDATYHIHGTPGIDRTTPHIIFPPFITNQPYSIPKTHAPYFADQKPIGFDYEEWNLIWERNHEVMLDDYLQYGRGVHDNQPIPWTYEHEFKGATYRLNIDFEHRNAELPLFTHGTILSFNNCNGFEYRYIIDHCTYTDDHLAYLKVVCFDTFQSYYDICSSRPPLIFAVPKSYCNARMHPNLEKNAIPHSIPLNSTIESGLNKLLSLWRHLSCYA